MPRQRRGVSLGTFLISVSSYIVAFIQHYYDTLNESEMSSVFFSCYNIFMDIKDIFSQNLVQFRKLKGLSQRELAKQTKLTQRIINYYENRPLSVPFANIETLADTLDVNITDFFNRQNKEEHNQFGSLDIRWIKKMYDIKQLPAEDQKEINRHINYLIEKNKSKKVKN